MRAGIKCKKVSICSQDLFRMPQKGRHDFVYLFISGTSGHLPKNRKQFIISYFLNILRLMTKDRSNL